MKILILSANTGEGHNSCGKALQEVFDQHGVECEFADVLAIASEKASKNASSLYVDSLQGNAFARIYKLATWVSNHWRFHRLSPIYLANKIYWRKLWHFIEAGQYDAIVTVHLFGAESLTGVKAEGKLHVPTFFIMTDYTLHAFLNDSELDYYVIPHEDLLPQWTASKIPFDHIFPIGIPVQRKTRENKIPKDEARKLALETVLKRSGANGQVSADGNWMLIMGGSMGFGNNAELVDALLKKADKNDKIIVVCGRNERGRVGLENRYKNEPRVYPIGYTDQIPLLMNATDVLFSKPGGLSSTEAIIRNVPLIHTAPIPGIESDNAQFFFDHGMSFYSLDINKQVDAAIKLCHDTHYREHMLKAQRDNSDPMAAEHIVQLVMHTLENNQTK